MLIHTNPRIQAVLKNIDDADRGGRLDEMLEQIQVLEQLAQELEDLAGLAAARYHLACYKHMTYQKQEALRLALDAVAFAREHNLPYYEMYGHNICGIIYEDMSDYAACLDRYLTGYDLAIQAGEVDYAPYFLVNIGNLFMVLDDFKNSLIYMKNGFAGLQSIEHPSNATRQNMAMAALNVIEAYVGSGNYKDALCWAREQGALLEQYGKSGIAACFLLIGRAKEQFHAGDFAAAEACLRPILTDAVKMENFNDYYTLNILLVALNLAVEMGCRTLAEQLLSALDDTRRRTDLNTFDYKMESCRIRYFDRFFSEDKNYMLAKEFFYPCYQAGTAAMEQLSRTYASSLHMRTELDRVKAERRNAQELNAELRRSVDLDPFTEVYNKMSVRSYIEKGLSPWQEGMVAALLVLDIDHFKRVNDTYGHPVGDRVIEGIARLMKGLFRQDDVVGRLGGDEFCVFLVGSCEQVILTRVEQLLEQVRAFRPAEQPSCAVTLSIGVCLLHAPVGYEEMVRSADRALYAAKERGRNRYEVAAPEG